MTNKSIKTIGIILTMCVSNLVIAEYDGRGSENCSELKKEIDQRKEWLRDSKSSYRGSIRLCRAWGNKNIFGQKVKGSCEERVSREELENAQDDLNDAKDNYNMNGCTSGGTTNYNHNYSH